VKVIRVLIADGNRAYRQGLYQMLEGERGIAVVGLAKDGQEAIEKSESLRPDVVLMDIDMPGTEGLRATSAIRERWPWVKVITLTLYSGEAFRAWAEDVEAAVLLPKDIDPGEIVEAIRMAGATR